MTDPLRDRIAAALYERERPPRDPHWPNAYAMDREVFEAMADAALGAVQPELDALAALRRVARGYCPACGRGDCATTADQWYEQRQRADKAEQERDTARQHAAAIAAQRDRLRQRMNTLADRWDNALAPDKPYARTLRNEISVAPFDPEGAMTVREYTERGRRLWAFRCWGTDTCDGWLGLGHHTQSSALIERERHVAEEHATGTRHVHVTITITNADAYTANRQALSLVDWINAEFPNLTVHTDAREEPAPAATQATDTTKEQP